jgi:hypothetical protein
MVCFNAQSLLNALNIFFFSSHSKSTLEEIRNIREQYYISRLRSIEKPFLKIKFTVFIVPTINSERLSK